MAKKTIELNGEQFVIHNIGFVFNNFEGTAYRVIPNRKFFKYKRLGYISFRIATCGSIEKDIIRQLEKLLDEEYRKKTIQKKIEEFEKTLDK